MTLSATAKRIGKLILPPIVTKPLNWLVSSKQPPTLEYLPNGEKDIENMAGVEGWNLERVVEAEAAKWPRFARHLSGSGPLGFSHESTDLNVVRNIRLHNIHVTFAYVLALAAWNKTTLSLLDWGGGLGHYYLIANAVLPQVKLDYHCRELALMCAKGRELCSTVTFYEDDACLDKKYDLVLLSGTLGYMPDWKEVLPSIAKTATEFLFITRVTVLENSPSILLLHRTDAFDYNSNMVVRVFNRNELLDVVKSSGFEVVREFVFDDPYHVPNAPEECQEVGWLFKRVG